MKRAVRRRWTWSRAGSGWLTVVLSLATAMEAAPQAAVDGDSPYADPGTAMLHEVAMRHHADGTDRLRAYEATVRQRIGIALRTPLRDRTLYRVESAHRVFWRNDGPASIEVLALREQTPGGVEMDDIEEGLVDHVFEPDRDRLLLGRSELEEGSDTADFRVHHPLEEDAAEHYRFASGDTVTLALPDGTRVTTVELRVSPLVRGATSISGSLWIERETGAIVRGVYRLSETLDVVRDIEGVREDDARGEFRWVPGLLKPWTFELSIITVDYALWEGGVWLPRRWRGEGQAVAGVLKIPAEFDRSYVFERVATDAQPAEASVGVGVIEPGAIASGYHLLVQDPQPRARELHMYLPEDPAVLADSPDLPPPVWEDAPGFITRDEIEAQIDRLDDVPTGLPATTPWWFRWGLQRPDLVRFNRVEELSIGARAAVRPELLGRPLSVTATARLGTGDLHPNVRLEAERNTLRRSTLLAAYHELAATDERARHLGLGNSLMAALGGRDDGDYYRRSGLALAWSSPPTARAAYRVSIHSEYHRAAMIETRIALPRLWNEDAWRFRPNVAAEEGWEHGLRATLTPSWGTDPERFQAGLELTGMVTFGDLEQRLASLTGRMALPLPGDWRVGLAAGGGVAADGVSPQRSFAVGGPGNLRGYDPRALVGPCAFHTRAEVQRRFAFGGLAAFSDAAWAGTCADLDPSDALRSLGVGLSLVDGLIRFDVARALDGGRGIRLDLYLDGLF